MSRLRKDRLLLDPEHKFSFPQPVYWSGENGKNITPVDWNRSNEYREQRNYRI